MKIESKNQKILYIIFIFIVIRIPLLYFPDFFNIRESIFINLIDGKIIYCDFDNFYLKNFWKVHVFPPIFYIYMFIVAISYNFFLLIIEFINLFLIYKILIKFYSFDSTLNALIIFSFFPMSILNCGYFPDPMGIGLMCILSSIYFFINNRILLATIIIAIGTLIIYITIIVLIPILFYYIKNEKNNVYNFLKIIIFFIISIVLMCLPFLIICPSKFLYYLNFSLNFPQSSNFLNHNDFFLSNLLNIILFNIINFDLKIINLIQIIIFLLTIVYLYKKFSFNNILEIFYSCIILISIISIITFYIHIRFMYWIINLDIIIFTINSDNFEEKFAIRKVLLIGIVYLIISISGLIFSLFYEIKGEVLYWIFAIIMILLYTYSFLTLNLFFLKEYDSKKIIINTFIITMIFLFYKTILILKYYFKFPYYIINFFYLIIIITYFSILIFNLNLIKEIFRRIQLFKIRS